MIRWFIAMDLPGLGCGDDACFLLIEEDEQQHMTLIDRWFVDPAALADKE